MNDKDKISRRRFLKGTIQAGGALMLASALPTHATELFPATNQAGNATTDELLNGVCDIHLHAYPDSSVRSVNEWGFALDA